MISQNSLEFATFLIFFLSVILGILAIFFMLKHYLKYSHEGLLILAIANVFTGFAPFAHVGQIIFHDERHEIDITNLSAVMISLLISGSYIHIIGFNRLVEQRSPKRIISLAPIYLIALIMNAVVIKHKYINGAWQVVYIPEYAFYLFSICVLIIQVDLYLLLYSLVRYTKIPRVKRIFKLNSLIFFSLVPLLILRRFIQLPQNIFLLPISMFYLLFTILITFYPLVFFSSAASPYYLVITDSTSNQILWQYTFLDPNNEQRSEQVFGQMSQFHDISNERLFNNDIKQIRTKTLQYYLENNNGLNFLLVLNRPSDSFKFLLYELAIEIGGLRPCPVKEADNPSKQIEYPQIKNSIDKIFIHQLDRLKLVRMDIDESVRYNIVHFINKNETMKLVLHPTRLSIIQIMNESDTILRTELQEILMINSGKLQRHIDVLREVEYIGEDILFVNNKPRKSIFITQKGRMVYASFKQHMRDITNRMNFYD